MKKFSLTLLIILLLSQHLYSGEILGVGLQFGLHDDVGNLSSRRGISLDTQTSCIIGITSMLDMDPFFFRTGTDFSIPVFKGKISDNTAGGLQETSIYYISFPFYLGLNLKIPKKGNIFIGGGGSCFHGFGNIGTDAGKQKFYKIAWGYGFLAGVQLNLTKSVRIHFDWEYLTAVSSPVVDSGAAAPDWNDFILDYTGHRFHIGAMYYFFDTRIL